jgi:integrase
MASLKTRRNKAGDITSYRVTWPLGGGRDGAWQNEYFKPEEEDRAKDFKNAVKAAGHQWPKGWLPGIGYVAEDVYKQAVQAAAPPPQEVTVRQHGARWISSRSGIEDYTVKRYRRILELHIYPYFGDVPIGDTDTLSSMAIGRWINQLKLGYGPDQDPGDDTLLPEREPLAPKSIRNAHGVLYSLIQSAVEAEPPLRRRNPCEHTVLPKHKEGRVLTVDEDDEDDYEAEEKSFLSPEEFDTLLTHLPEDARDLVEFMVMTGLRYSEATALQVRDFDLMGPIPTVMVQRAWKRVGNGTWRLGPPKTERSRRRISLTPSLMEIVLRLVAGRTRRQFVFVRAGGHRWGHSTFYTHRWRPALYRAVRCAQCQVDDDRAGITRRGLRYLKKEHIVPCGCGGVLEKTPRIHDLRHTHVAWLIAAKTPLPKIRERLGHASIQVTIDLYGGLLTDLESDLIEALDAVRTRRPLPAPVVVI